MEGIGFSLFVYFHSFLITISIIQIEKSIDGVLGIETWGCRMVGADETTELWRPPNGRDCYNLIKIKRISCCCIFFRAGLAYRIIYMFVNEPSFNPLHQNLNQRTLALLEKGPQFVSLLW